MHNQGLEDHFPLFILQSGHYAPSRRVVIWAPLYMVRGLWIMPFPASCSLPPLWFVCWPVPAGIPTPLRSLGTKSCHHACIYDLPSCSHPCECLPSLWFPSFVTDMRLISQVFSALLASAETITIVVGGNGTNQDASLIFQPQEVKAAVGDIVVFNCTSAVMRPSPHPQASRFALIR